MKPKRHVVFGRSMSYEQVADALYMNVQTLRTLCGKKCGGDLEKYLISRGINKETFDNIMEGTAIVKEDVKEKETGTSSAPASAGAPSPSPWKAEEATIVSVEDVKLEEVDTDQAVDQMMRAIFGEGYKSGEKGEKDMDETKNVSAENDPKTEDTKRERMQLIVLNRTIDDIDGVSDLVKVIGCDNKELKDEIDRCSVKLATLLDEFRIENYSFLIDWNQVAEHMGETEYESNADLRAE